MRETQEPQLTSAVWRGHAWRIIALWALVAAAYSNCFQAGLVFDNAAAIAEDPRIRQASAHHVRLILTQDYWYNRGISGLYRPITTLSYLINYSVLGDGTRPAGYHWVNLGLHTVNVGLVYALGIFIFEDAALALALAAIWGLHPLLTESVTNIVGRADLLAGFGVLLGLLCYLKGIGSAGKRRLAWFAGLAAAQTVGLFSKESAAVLPGLMLLHDWIWPRRARWRTRWPAYVALALPFALFFFLRSQAHTHLTVAWAENPLAGAGFWTARLTAVKVMGKFLWLFAWPARLSADYSYNAIPLFGWRLSWEDAKAVLALLVCAAMAGLALANVKTKLNSAFAFFALFFFVALAPVSNLIVVIGSVMAERFVYLPAVGLAGCLVLAIHALTRRWPRIQSAAMAAICLAFGLRTYARNFDWHDDLSLWSSAVAAYPKAARPHNNLGNALANMPGRLPDAIVQFHAALRIEPDYADAHYNLGNALAKAPGRLPGAIAEYHAALRSDPAYAKAHINLGNLLARTPGRLQDAVAEYRAALSIEPGNADAHYNLGNVLAVLPGRLQDAIAEYRAALTDDPESAKVHNNLGSALSQMPGHLPDAIAEYQAALRIDPDYAKAHNNLGNALVRMPGRLPDAIAEYQAALRSQPDFADAHFNLGSALARVPGRVPDAIAEFEAVLRIGPDPQAQKMLERLRALR